MSFQLVEPDVSFWGSWLESRDEWGGPAVHQPGAALDTAHRRGFDVDERSGFARWVEELRAQPYATPEPGRVVATNWWMVRDGTYLGAIQLRHSLTEFLADVGGHIGYGIRPSARRNGFASAALFEVLTYAGEQVGLSEVLITCDEHNISSRKTVERCGGVVESVRPADDLSRGLGHTGDTLRYWVAT